MCTNSFLFAAFASIQGRYITHLLPYEDASSYEQPCYEPVCMSNGTDKKAEQESVSYKKAEEWDEEFQRHQKIIENEALRATLQKETGALSINEKADSKEKENDMGNYKEERTTGGKVSRSLSFKENINHRSTSSEEKNSHIIYKHDKKAEEEPVSYKKSEEEDEEFFRFKKMFKNEALRAMFQRESGTLSINEEADSKEKVNNMDSYKEDRTTGDKISGNISHKEAEEMLENIFENETLRATLEKESGTSSINEEMEYNKKVSDASSYEQPCYEPVCKSNGTDKKAEQESVSYKKAEEWDEVFQRYQKIIENEAPRATLQKETGALSINEEEDSKEKENYMGNYKEERTTGGKVSRSLSFKKNINHRSTSSEEKSHIIYKHDKKAEEGAVSYKKSEEEDESYKKAEEWDEEFKRHQKIIENEALRATLQKETGALSINEEADSKEKVNNMDSYKEDRTTGDKISGNISHKEAEEMLENIFENKALRATLEKESGTSSINAS